MTIVQTSLSEQEYQILADYAERGDLSLQAALREAVLRLALDRPVNPAARVFTRPPAIAPTGKRRSLAARHDQLLYRRRPKR